MNERQIFEAAIDIADLARREAFLLQACGADAALRARVDALLTSHAAASQFLETPVVQQLNTPPDSSGENTMQLPPSNAPAAGDDDSEDGMNLSGPDISFLSPSAKPGSIGTLGHYEILNVLGQGAFGIVFRAFDEKLHRHVAIKTMSVQMAATSPPRKRFLREARAAAAIRHENVVQVYSVDEQPLPYLVMEFIDGETLQQKQRDHGPLEVSELLHIGRQIASGLAAAHSQTLIHRDVKPGNILLEKGAEQKVKITDFGLARAADDASLTRSGMISGTPLYMAPEQALGQTMDHRSDLFSLGSVLYELATGRPPFRAPNTVAVLRRVVDDTPRPIQEIIPECPDWVVTIINKLLEKQPDERYQSAKEVADLLARCQSELQLTGQVTCVPGAGSVSARSTPNATTITSAAAKDSGGSRPPLSGKTKSLIGGLAVLAIIPALWYILTPSPNPPVNHPANGMASAPEVPVRTADSHKRPETPATDTMETDSDRRAAEYVLSIDGKIGIKENGQERSFLAVSDLPRGTISLSTVNLDGNERVTDVGLAVFSGCMNIEHLKIENTSVGDAGLAYFQDCKNLVELCVGSKNVTDAGLMHFRNCSQLTALSLSGCDRVTDVGLAYFKDCAKLQQLTLGGTRVSDVGLAYFKNCPDLYQLWLTESPNITDAGLAYFKDCPQLVTLDLRNTPTTDAGLAYFKACPNLTSISLGGTQITDTGLAHFATCPKLREIQLDNNRLVSMAALDHFRASPEITNFALDLRDIDDDDMVIFREWKNLTALGFGASSVTDAGLNDLKECRNLTLLRLRQSKITEAGVEDFQRALPRCKIEWDGGVIEPSPLIDFAAERQVAEWVLENKGSMELAVSPDWQWPVYGTPGDAKPLPSEPFVVASLRMTNSQVKTASDLEQLTRCRYLEAFVISGGTIDPQTMELLTRLPRLKTLSLSHQINLRTSALVKLGQISTLDHLAITSDMVDDKLEFVRHIPALRTLIIHGPQPPDIDLLAETPQLRTILLTTPDAVDDAKLAAVQSRHDKLRIVVGWMGKYRTVGRDPAHEAAKQLVNIGVECFGGVNYWQAPTKLLTKADLEDGSVWSFSVSKVPASVQLSADDREKLKLLNSYHFAAEGQREADELAQSLSGNHGIASITLTDSDLTDAGLEHLQKLVSLRALSLTKTKVTPAGIERFHRAVPWCGISSDFGTTLPDFMLEAAAQSKVDNKPTGWHGWPVDAPKPAVAPFSAEQAKKHQEEWAAYLKIPVEYTNTIGMKFRLIPPGEFLMGSTKEEVESVVAMIPESWGKVWHESVRGEHPQHRVVLTHAFYLGIHEVSQGQFEKVIGRNPSHFSPPGNGAKLVDGIDSSRLPVENVTWNDAVDFCGKISVHEKTEAPQLGYRLPTEAEWEYSCRAGTSTRYSDGNDTVTDQRVGWFWPAGDRTHSGGECTPNSFGLFDMHGNVWEWVNDIWQVDYYSHLSTSLVVDPIGPVESAPMRSMRGGTFALASHVGRSAHRSAAMSNSAVPDRGFRIALPADAVRQALKVTGSTLPKPAGPPPSVSTRWYKSPEFEAWAREVAAMPIVKQVEAVSQKLVELNPSFDGNVTPDFGNDVVTGIAFRSDHVADISPVRALGGLQSLRIAGAWRNTVFQDLSPLQGMSLKELGIEGTRVSDLSPLKEMKLEVFRCGYTQVSDLTPLKEMTLTTVNCWHTPVTDLSSLNPAKLTTLELNGTGVPDLSVLKGFQLNSLSFTATQISDLTPLQGMPLEGLDCGLTPVKDLSPLNGMKLKYLNCGGTQISSLLPLQDSPLTSLICSDTQISDLSPLEGKKLTSLYCGNTQISDLSPLKGMELTGFFCAGTKVIDYSSLNGMPLRSIELDFQPDRDSELLHSMKQLQSINNKTSAEFWKNAAEQR